MAGLFPSINEMVGVWRAAAVQSEKAAEAETARAAELTALSRKFADEAEQAQERSNFHKNLAEHQHDLADATTAYAANPTDENSARLTARNIAFGRFLRKVNSGSVR